MKETGFFLIAALLLICTSLEAPVAAGDLFKKDDVQKHWVDSIMSRMTVDQKIGQLLMPYAYAGGRRGDNTEELMEWIEKYHIGGIMIGGGKPHTYVNWINRYQEKSEIPLIISIDGEWGAAMRVDSLMSYPWNMTLGAVNDQELIYRIGQSMGLQCKRMGININFAPVVDVNVNSNNPIVGNRSFGSDRDIVTSRAVSIAMGMQSVGVMANVKHFPGHGDTETDSHKALPVLPFSRQRLDSLELYPFRQLIDAGVGSVMVGHLSVKALEPGGGPTSLSHRVVTDLLRNKMNFKGICFTDGMEMKGVMNYAPIDQAAVKAILAGHDIILEAKNVAVMFDAIKKAVQDKKITEKRLNESVERILTMKYWMGLHAFQPVSSENLMKELNTERDSALCLETMEKAVTLLRNEDKMLPVTDLVSRQICWVHLGPGDYETFGDYLRRYAPVKEIDANAIPAGRLRDSIPGKDYIIVSYHNINGNPILLKPAISPENQEKIAALNGKKNNVLVLFNMPYGLLGWNGYELYKSLMVSYQNNPFSHLATAELLFGAIEPQGTLPVALSPKYPAGFGLTFEKTGRLAYGFPSQAGMSSDRMQQADALVRDVVKEKAAPAVHVLVARKGRVIYNKSYGTTMYDMPGSEPVNNGMIYDMASVTKIMACLPMIMKMVDEGALSLDDKIGDLVPVFKGTDKGNILVRDLLTHTAGLKEWIPFYLQTIDEKGNPLDKYYAAESDTAEPRIPITESLYAKKEAAGELWRQILESPVKEEKAYAYSDIGFMFLQAIVENHYHSKLDSLSRSCFYEPIGAYRTGYLPLEHFGAGEIVPSENDTYWRNGVVRGYVHDMTAPFMGGVSGHAGLFSTAEDMAKMGQMYLNGGYYGGKQYISSETLQRFSSCQDGDKGFYRGLGFDRPRANSTVMSQQAFGHTGFTGTCVWVDPAYDLVYIFLSNRVFLSMNDNTLQKLDFRNRIQKAFVEAIVE